MTLTQDQQSTLTSLAEQMAVEMSEEQLLREIGLRVRTLAMHPAAARRLEMSVPEAAALERAWDDLNEFGGWIFRRLHRQLQSVRSTKVDVADGEVSRTSPELFNSTANGIVSDLTATLGVAPAVASVVTALALKRLLKPGWEETYSGATGLVTPAR